MDDPYSINLISFPLFEINWFPNVAYISALTRLFPFTWPRYFWSGDIFYVNEPNEIFRFLSLFLKLSLACRHLQNNEWLIVKFIEPVRIHRYATTLFFTLFNWMDSFSRIQTAQPNIILSVLCDCQRPVALQAYVKRFHPQHGFKPCAILFFGRWTKGWLTAPISCHYCTCSSYTMFQHNYNCTTRALTFRVDHNYNSLLKFQRQPTKFSLLFRQIVSVTYRAIYEI